MTDLSGFSALVAEDEEMLREAISYELSNSGLRVFETENGRDALALIKKESIDLVFSDIRMPDGDGLELLDAVKNLPEPKPIVFMMSGFSEHSEEELIERGAVALIPKPFSIRDLTTVILNNLKGRR